jgi:hypothetical protein
VGGFLVTQADRSGWSKFPLLTANPPPPLARPAAPLPAPPPLCPNNVWNYLFV